MRKLRRPSPALALSLLALFFALGGTAFAIGAKVVPQPRCATGAVRGIAIVGGTNTDLSSLPTTLASHPDAVPYSWSCTGGQVMISKLSGAQGIAVKFVGNPATVAIVSSAASNGGPYGGSVSRASDGSFHVVMGGANGITVPGEWEPQWDIPFTIVLL
jgi:hypothetical protein